VLKEDSSFDNISFDLVKIKGGLTFAKGLKDEGLKV